MQRSALTRTNRSQRRWPSSLLALCALVLSGCSILGDRDVPPLSGNGGVNRRTQLWRVTAREATRKRPVSTRPVSTRPVATRPATTGPAGMRPVAIRPDLPPLTSVRPTSTTQPSASQPAETLEPIAEPYRLNTANVIRIVYFKSPLVISSREEMIAARYGLEEFRANLSRFEPFVRVDGGASEFPERRGARGYQGELVGGIDRETFDGSVFRLEGGVNSSRFRFDGTEDKPAETQSGSGGVVRGRIEVPFIGSRKRQDRTIQQAYQESTARQAMLEYLGDYRSHASNALLDYRQTILYLNQMRAYEDQIAALEALLALPGLTNDERMPLQSTTAGCRRATGRPC
jgi:hypothetical protein